MTSHSLASFDPILDCYNPQKNSDFNESVFFKKKSIFS